MASTENKVHYGLCNVHVATLDESELGTPTFEVPKAIPGAVSLTMDPEGEDSPFYADNTVYYTTTTNNGYTGELALAELPDWYLTEYLGQIKTKEGMILEASDQKPKPHALLFQFEGDVKATKHIIYKVQPSRPTIEGSTKEDTTEPATTTLPFTAMPLQTSTMGNIIKAKVPAEASNYATFFTTAPTIPTSVSEMSTLSSKSKKEL